MHTSITMASVSIGGQGFVSADVVLEEMISGGSGGPAVVASTDVAPVVAGHGAAPLELDPAADVEVAAPVAAGGAGGGNKVCEFWVAQFQCKNLIILSDIPNYYLSICWCWSRSWELMQQLSGKMVFVKSKLNK